MDYRKYQCKRWERLGYFAVGTTLTAVISWLFYRSWYGMVLVIPINYLIIFYYKNKKRDERAKKLMIEFRDAIMSVAAALLAGYSIEHAWKEAEREVSDLYGTEAMITKELVQMNAEIKLNRNVEEILHDLAIRKFCRDFWFCEKKRRRFCGNYQDDCNTDISKDRSGAGSGYGYSREKIRRKDYGDNAFFYSCVSELCIGGIY